MGKAQLKKKNALEDNVVQGLLQERVNERIASGRLFDLGQMKFAALPPVPKTKLTHHLVHIY